MEKIPDRLRGLDIQRVKINVYFIDGRVSSYYVDNGEKAREHAHAIITKGWRNVSNGIMEYYPIHKIDKVTFDDPKDMLSEKYEGQANG